MRKFDGKKKGAHRATFVAATCMLAGWFAAASAIGQAHAANQPANLAPDSKVTVDYRQVNLPALATGGYAVPSMHATGRNHRHRGCERVVACRRWS